MAVFKYALIFFIFLSGCVAYKQDGDWVRKSLFEAPEPRTDLVDGDFTLTLSTRSENDYICGDIVKGCAIGYHITMYGWDAGEHRLKIKVKFVKWSEKPYFENGVLYTHAYHIDDPNLGYIGAILAEQLELEAGRFNREDTLGHEFWHTLGFEH